MHVRRLVGALLALVPIVASLRLDPTWKSGRRAVVTAAVAAAAAHSVPVLATGNMPVLQGAPGKMDGKVKAVTTPAAAKQQIVAGYGTLNTLVDDFDKVTAKGGGDGIRRVVGTVGTDSPVYLIERVPTGDRTHVSFCLDRRACTRNQLCAVASRLAPQPRSASSSKPTRACRWSTSSGSNRS